MKLIHSVLLAFLIFATLTFPLYAEEDMTDDAPKINIRFLFVMCNDIDAMRHFYTELLGMSESSYMNDEEWGWLTYKTEGFDFMFFRAQEEMPYIEDWVWQPGWGGDIPGTSWAVNIPEDMFADVVNALRDDGSVPHYCDLPEWRQESYWGLTVKDPMGNSVEVYSSPAEKPESTVWPELEAEEND